MTLNREDLFYFYIFNKLTTIYIFIFKNLILFFSAISFNFLSLVFNRPQTKDIFIVLSKINSFRALCAQYHHQKIQY